jgi:hypothetical protein
MQDLQSPARERQAETTSAPAHSGSWRDHLKIHPAAELFPSMSEPELRELGEDIKKNGLRQPIIYCKPPGDKDGKPVLLDGRNRLDAMELVGIATVDENGIVRHKNGAVYNGTDLAYPGLPDQDPYDLVLSLNIHRRHLDEEERRDLIAKLIKAKPEASDRAIAKKVKRDHKTVAKIRKKLESTGEMSPVEKRIGADGKKRKKPAKKRMVETDQERRDRMTCIAIAKGEIGDACIMAAERSQIALECFKNSCLAWLPDLTNEDLAKAGEFFHDYIQRRLARPADAGAGS